MPTHQEVIESLCAQVEQLRRERDDAREQLARCDRACKATAEVARAVISRLEREAAETVKERDAARDVARQLLPFCKGREDIPLGIAIDLITRYPWLNEKAPQGEEQ